MAIQTQYCRCWYLISAACMIAYAQAADITWLQWTGQSGGYIGLSSETSRVPLSGVAPICSLEGGAILDPAVVDVTSKEFATLIVECLNIDITNFNFWVNGSEEEGHCPGIVLQNKLFRSTYFVCTTQTRYICYSTEDKTVPTCLLDPTKQLTTTAGEVVTDTTTRDTPRNTTLTENRNGTTAQLTTTAGEVVTDTKTPGKQPAGQNVAIYAGSAVGGAVILIVVAILIVYCKRTTRHGSSQSHVYINSGSVTKTMDTPRTSSLKSSGTDAVPPSNINVNVNQGAEQELKQGSPQEDSPDYTALSNSSRDPLPQETPYEGITGTFDPELHDQVRGGGVPYAEFTIQSADGSQRGDDTPYEDVTGLSL